MVTLENLHVQEILQITVSKTQMIIYNCKLFSAASFLKFGQQQNSFERKNLGPRPMNCTHDLLKKRQVSYQLSYENSWRARSLTEVIVTGVLHTARISTVEVIMSSDK